MDRRNIEYGNATIDEGFFLRRPETNVFHLPYTDEQGDFFRHLSTFPERSTIREAVQELLQNAREHVFFANFLIQDERIKDSLIKTARRLQGHVYILTTLTEEDFQALDPEFLEENPHLFFKHMDHIQELSTQGLAVKARSDCHAKFMTIDDTHAIVTSANAVPTCYGDTRFPDGNLRPANGENGVLLSLPSEVKRLANFFRTIWQSACNHYVIPNRQRFSVQKYAEGLPVIHCRESNAAPEGEILWTTPTDPRIRTRILAMIDRCRHRLRISTYIIKDMNNHPMGQSLLRAADRGVKIEILVREMNLRDDHRKGCAFLVQGAPGGINILGDSFNHSKALVADDDEAMVLTANLDPRHGLDTGVETAFWSPRPGFVAAVSKYLGHLTGEAVYTFTLHPTQAQIGERAGSPWPPILGGDLILNVNHRWKDRDLRIEELRQEIKTQVVRVVHPDKENKLYLLTNQSRIVCIPDRNQNNLFQDTYIDKDTRLLREKRYHSYLQKGRIIFQVWNH